MELYTSNGLDFRKAVDGDFVIITGDETIKKLKELRIENVELNDSVGFRITSLKFLNECPFIKRLSIVLLKNVDLEPIHALRELVSLRITKNFNQRINFACFPRLKECHLHWNLKIENFNAINDLEQLELYDFKKTDLTDVKQLNKLRILSILQSQIVEVSGIEYLNNLQQLELIDNKKLKSLEGVERLQKLVRLNIENCPNVNDIEPVGNLTDLEFLGLHDCKGINTLSPIKGLKRLQEIYLTGNTNILDGNLDTLVGRKDAVFGPRKHYSHHPDEIDKLNGTIRPKQTWDW
jgi:Leucine-rich repeat (LRR) protein